MLTVTRKAANSLVFRVDLLDSSSSNGAGLTGLTHSSTGLKITVMRELDASPVEYAVADSELETITTLGTYQTPTSGKVRFKEISSSLFPGHYEIHLEEDTLDADDVSRYADVLVWGATNLAPRKIRIPLVAVDPQDSVRMGQTALPNATAGSSNGLWILGSMTGSPAITGSFSIANASGSAMTLLSAGSNGAGLTLAGNGSGAGLSATGGATGAGFAGIGGATSGHAMSLIATAGNSYGLLAQGAGAGAAHGVYFDGNGTGVDLKLAADDPLPANVTKWSGTAVATPDTAGYPKVTIKSGTGTGELSITSGVVGADAVQISGDATAANNLEAMLDGTGGVALSLGSIAVSGNTTLTGSLSVAGGTTLFGPAIGLTILGTTVGMSIDGATSDGVTISSAAGARGLWIEGGAYGVKIDPVDASGIGIWVDGGLSGGAALEISGHDSGSVAVRISQYGVGPAYVYDPDGGAVILNSITGSLIGNITGNLSGSVGSVTGSVGSLTTNNDKTGYALSSSGLDSISTTAPSGVASNFREMLVQVWRRLFKKSTLTSTELKTYADNGSTVITTQTVSDSGGTQTVGTAS